MQFFPLFFPQMEPIGIVNIERVANMLLERFHKVGSASTFRDCGSRQPFPFGKVGNVHDRLSVMLDAKIGERESGLPIFFADLHVECAHSTPSDHVSQEMLP